jgi:chromosome segregation ATPase
MFGEALRGAAEEFARTRFLICRPYRPGTCPTNPNNGTVMERGFYPDAVESSLEGVGLTAWQMISRNRECTLDMNPNIRGQTKTFRIRATKEANDLEALIAAREAHLEKIGAQRDAIWTRADATSPVGGDAGTSNSIRSGNEVARKQETIEVLTKRLEALTPSVDSLERRRTELHDTIARLKDRHSVLVRSIGELEDQRAGLLANVRDLRAAG